MSSRKRVRRAVTFFVCVCIWGGQPAQAQARSIRIEPSGIEEVAAQVFIYGMKHGKDASIRDTIEMTVSDCLRGNDKIDKPVIVIPPYLENVKREWLVVRIIINLEDTPYFVFISSTTQNGRQFSWMSASPAIGRTDDENAYVRSLEKLSCDAARLVSLK